MIDPTLIAILAIPATGCAIIVGRWLWGLKPQHKFDRIYAEWARDASGSFEDQQQEAALRYAVVRLRRRTSAEVSRDPSQYAATIDRLAAEEGLSLATRDRAMGRRFMKWAAAADPSEILYRNALDALYRWSRDGAAKKHVIRQDDIAAFTTL